MDPITILSAVVSALALARSLQDRITGERITQSEDIIATFTEYQAIVITRIQNEILSGLPVPDPLRPLPPAEADLLYGRLEPALQRYAKALRDYETLSQESLPHNPFAQQWLLPPLAPTAALQPFAAILRFRELDKKGRLAREKRSAALERLLLGSFGGLMLIGPMLVMVLHYTRNTTLVTTSVATALFTLVLAMFARAMAGKDVLAAVAAYAAVLMVFVGTSLGSGAGV